MQVKIPDARLAFGHLYTAKQVMGQGEPAFSASFIIDKNSPAVKTLNATIEAVAKAKWGDKAPGILKTLRAGDKVCLRDGDIKPDYEGFPGNFFVSARNKTRPVVKDRDTSPLTEADGKPYSGCYVNGVLDIWAQDSPQFGKRVNATLQGVQFVRDGDAFSGAPPLKDDVFDDLGVPEEATAGGLA